jgi:hypothetical protein
LQERRGAETCRGVVEVIRPGHLPCAGTCLKNVLSADFTDWRRWGAEKICEIGGICGRGFPGPKHCHHLVSSSLSNRRRAINGSKGESGERAGSRTPPSSGPINSTRTKVTSGRL